MESQWQMKMNAFIIDESEDVDNKKIDMA